MQVLGPKLVSYEHTTVSATWRVFNEPERDTPSVSVGGHWTVETCRLATVGSAAACAPVRARAANRKIEALKVRMLNGQVNK